MVIGAGTIFLLAAFLIRDLVIFTRAKFKVGPARENAELDVSVMKKFDTQMRAKSGVRLGAALGVANM
ncbi:MAG: hypothetical protein DDT20_00430 [Firmicutes bacterium]|nr:hypothetical protein [Bacillota bacterium]